MNEGNRKIDVLGPCLRNTGERRLSLVSFMTVRQDPCDHYDDRRVRDGPFQGRHLGDRLYDRRLRWLALSRPPVPVSEHVRELSAPRSFPGCDGRFDRGAGERHEDVRSVLPPGGRPRDGCVSLVQL